MGFSTKNGCFLREHKRRNQVVENCHSTLFPKHFWGRLIWLIWYLFEDYFFKVFYHICANDGHTWHGPITKNFLKWNPMSPRPFLSFFLVSKVDPESNTNHSRWILDSKENNSCYNSLLEFCTNALESSVDVLF